MGSCSPSPPSTELTAMMPPMNEPMQSLSLPNRDLPKLTSHRLYCQMKCSPSACSHFASSSCNASTTYNALSSTISPTTLSCLTLAITLKQTTPWEVCQHAGPHDGHQHVTEGVLDEALAYGGHIVEGVPPLQEVGHRLHLGGGVHGQLQVVAQPGAERVSGAHVLLPTA